MDRQKNRGSIQKSKTKKKFICCSVDLYCLFAGCLTLGDLEARVNEDLVSSFEFFLSSSLFAEVPELTATAMVPTVRRLIFERFAGKLSLRLSCLKLRKSHDIRNAKALRKVSSKT